MIEILLPLTIAACSLALGHILTRAWERARPFTVIHKIDACYRTGDLVIVEQKLAEATDKCWTTPALASGERPVSELATTVHHATNYLESTRDGQDQIRSVVSRLESSHSDAETVTGISDILTHVGLRMTIEMFILRGGATLPSVTQPADKEIVRVFEANDAEGAFFVELPQNLVRLGTSGSTSRALAEKLRPLVDIIRAADRDALVELLKTTSYHMQEQTDLALQIKKIAEPVLDANSRWDAKAVLVNYGKSSLVLWPGAVLHVRDRRTSSHFECNCKLVSNELSPIEQLTVVSPDGSISLHIISELRHKELAEGNAIRELYERGSGRAAVKFTITHRNKTSPSCFVSQWMPFEAEK